MSVRTSSVNTMDEIDVEFSFYDDPDYVSDADRDSRKLKRWHQLLWSKPLPSGDRLEWSLELGTSCLLYGTLRASSDTIASTHANYHRVGTARLYEGLTEAEREKYERAFYTIGGFIIFPTRPRHSTNVAGPRARSPIGSTSHSSASDGTTWVTP